MRRSARRRGEPSQACEALARSLEVTDKREANEQLLGDKADATQDWDGGETRLVRREATETR